MAIAVALIVANIYYIQPLLADIAREFHLTAAGAGTVAMLSQLGTACGMMVLVPLGDIRERRSLIAFLVGLLALALAGFAAAPSLLWLCLTAAAVGASGCAVHLIIPFAAHIAPPQTRGRVIGTVVGGVLMGILLARTLSGYVGAQWGWRTMYWSASGMMAVLCVVIRFYLPKSEPEVRFTYAALLRSVWGLVRDQPALREAAFTGSMMFLAFSAFWTTLTFRLEAPPFHYGSTVAGLFGLVGAAGAAAAPLIGRLADRFGPRAAIGWALGIGILSFLILAAAGSTLTGLIVGVIIMDLCVQAGHVSNQTRIYAIDPAARGRLNAVYMTSYFAGGSTGSFLGGLCWRFGHWSAVCACGVCAMAVGLAAHLRGGRALRRA